MRKLFNLLMKLATFLLSNWPTTANAGLSVEEIFRTRDVFNDIIEAQEIQNVLLTQLFFSILLRFIWQTKYRDKIEKIDQKKCKQVDFRLLLCDVIRFALLGFALLLHQFSKTSELVRIISLSLECFTIVLPPIEGGILYHMHKIKKEAEKKDNPIDE